MKFIPLITTILAIATLTARAFTVEAFDATSSLSDQFKATHNDKEGIYTFCGFPTSNDIKNSYSNAPLKKKNATTILLSNGSLCSVHRISNSSSGTANFKVEIRGHQGKMDATVSAMTGQGFVIFSRIGADESNPKFYLVKINN